MEDLSFQLNRLNYRHHTLDKATTLLQKELAKHPNDTRLQANLADLKKQKLKIRDMITNLEKRQEYDMLDDEYWSYDEGQSSNSSAA